MNRLPELGTLGEFLAAHRARLAPEAAGVSYPGSRRRVPGLRREELAMLAGVSASYYTRLEQGQAAHASRQVIDAISRALRLSETEREHLHMLAVQGEERPATVEPDAESIGTGLLELLDNMGDTPAIVFGRRRDILGWNRMGHALLAGHLDRDSVDDPASRPNATELVFLDSHTRELYVDWNDKALASVGHLRMLAAQFPTDAKLLELIGRLTVASADFATMWASNRIRTSKSVTYRMQHPLVGLLTLNQQLLTSAHAPGQTLVVCTTPSGASSSEALRLLAQLSDD